MQKLGLSGLRGIDGFRSLAGPNSTAGKPANPRPSSDAGGGSYGSFANLNMTAEKLVKEQASVKTDLEIMHTKLKRATEQINMLEVKLQQAVNENVKLKVKRTEDSKLWQGLDSKVSSTNTLCDQLTETLQQLACQLERAEEDKKVFEETLGKNSKALDEFNCLLHDTLAKLECAEQNIMSGKQEMLRIKQEKEEMDRSYKEQIYANGTTVREKDSLIKQLEVLVEENIARLLCADSRLQCMEQELKLKQDVCTCLKENLASAEKDKNDLELRNQGYSLEIERLCKDNKDANALLSSFVAKVAELDKEHASLSSHVSRLLSSFEKYYGMVQEEKMLIPRSAKDKLEHLQNQFVDLTSENSGLKTEIGELKSRITELQKTQKIVMVQHVEECQVAEDKIRRLETEAETSASNASRLEKLSSELQGRVQKLLGDSSLAENQKEELIQKTLKVESDNQELLGRAHPVLDGKSNDTESLQHEIANRDLQVEAFEKHISKLRSFLDANEQLYISSMEREKSLEEQKLQVQASLAATECQLTEAKKQYDLMLVGKQIELSKHLKELSLGNDQAINDIRKKYELEKVEIICAEKKKAEKLIKEMENKCNEKIFENKRESERCLTRLKEKHCTVVARIQQDNELKESNLRNYHKEELQRIRSQAENELKERLSSLRQEHEAQINSVNIKHEEDCQKLQDELELQKSKEEKQRALLQWKVMGENQQVDQEVSSKKRRDSYVRKESQVQLAGPETKRKDVKLPGVIQSPISTAMRKVEKGTLDVPNDRKVTHHEVEPANGRIRKNRKTTKNTLIFGEQKTQKSHNTAEMDVTRTNKKIERPASSKQGECGSIDVEVSGQEKLLHDQPTITQIFVRHGKSTLTLEVNLGESLKYVLEDYKKRLNQKDLDVYFAYNSKILDLNRTLSSYGIVHGCTIEANYRTRGGSPGLSFMQYVAAHKAKFRTIQKMPDGNLSLKSTLLGCRFTSSLLECFVSTWSKRKSWDGLYKWDTHFCIVDGVVTIAKEAKGGLQSTCMENDIKPLLELLNDIFYDDDIRLRDNLPPYFTHLIAYLKSLKSTVLTDDDRLILLSHVHAMESYERLMLAIGLRRKYKGLSKDEKKIWDGAIKKALQGVSWTHGLLKLPVFEDLNTKATSKGDPYAERKEVYFRLIRDYASHCLEHRWINEVEMFKDDDGVELMIPMYTCNFLARLVQELIVAKIDITRELSSAVVRYSKCKIKELVHPVELERVSDNYKPTWMQSLSVADIDRLRQTRSRKYIDASSQNAGSNSQKPNAWTIGKTPLTNGIPSRQQTGIIISANAASSQNAGTSESQPGTSSRSLPAGAVWGRGAASATAPGTSQTNSTAPGAYQSHATAAGAGKNNSKREKKIDWDLQLMK